MTQFYFASINFNDQIYALLGFGILGVIAVFFQLLQIFINKRNGIKKKPVYSLLIISIIIAFAGIKGYFSWIDFKANNEKTIGITLRYKPYAKTSSVIEYEYYVKGEKFIGESSYSSADFKKIKIPGGKYPVYYNAKNPKISEMDFSKVPKSKW